MYNGSLADSLQLAISINCLTLLLIITVVYLIYYARSKEKAFRAGGLVTMNIAVFVLLETLIIITGWTGNIPLGRQLHKAEQIFIFLFLAVLPYFMLSNLPSKGRLKKILEFFIWIGLALTAATAVAGYLFPDSLISVESASVTPSKSPGDFSRGLEGPLFIVRDVMLGVFILLSLVYSIYYLVKKGRTFQSVMMFAGILIAIFGGIDDIQYIYTGRNILFDQLRFSRFVLFATVMMLFFLAAVFSRFFSAHTLLNKTRHDLKVSENKYSLLMDAADEIMFSLSKDLKIIEANSKAEQLFRLTGEQKSFVDCLYRSEYESKANNAFFREQLLELREAGEKLSLNTYVMDPVTREPVEYHFRFDCFYDEDDLELIGRAWPTASSRLMDFIGTERLTIDVENYITIVGDIVDRLTTSIKRYLEEGDVMMIKMGLNEMIVNAMEHGNLNVSFDEKTEAQEQGRLFEFMSERRQQPEYRDKKVTIDYYFDDSRVIYRITDMGPGFDYRKIMSRVRNEVNQNGLTHGRGIIMTQAVFDKVQYNSRGNQVLLIKEFNNKSN